MDRQTAEELALAWNDLMEESGFTPNASADEAPDERGDYVMVFIRHGCTVMCYTPKAVFKQLTMMVVENIKGQVRDNANTMYYHKLDH